MSLTLVDPTNTPINDTILKASVQNNTNNEYDNINSTNENVTLETNLKDIVLRIEQWWMYHHNRKIFRVLKQGICAAERTLSYVILKKISPAEAELLKDPSLKPRVRFRFGGYSFPPTVLFKIYTSVQSGNTIHYFSGKNSIKPGTQAAVDARKQMGNRKLLEQILSDTSQIKPGRVTDDGEVANLKDYLQYRACLDETPAYLGGKDNSWRELDLSALPRHHIMHDVNLYITRGVTTKRLKLAFPKYWPHSPCEKMRQLESLIQYKRRQENNLLTSLAPNSRSGTRKIAENRAKAMRAAYMQQDRIDSDDNVVSEFNKVNLETKNDADAEYDNDDDDEALSLYEWTQTLPIEVIMDFNID